MVEFDKNVFINCPFDEEFKPLLKVLLFVVKKVGLNPRISVESSDSGQVRLHKIKQLLEESKYGIHDLSRARSNKKGEYYRLNMPFELGLDLGCRDYNADTKYSKKKMLILEKEKYSTQKALSDLSFADCKCHKGEPEELVYQIRDWFSENGMENIASASSLWDGYNIFYADLYEKKALAGFKSNDIDRLPIAEFMRYIDENVRA